MYCSFESRKMGTALLGLLILLTPAMPAQSQDKDTDTKGVPRHLEQARQLVENLQSAKENVYGGGKRYIDWEAGNCAARTVCSSFTTLLLQHTYGWTNADFKAWMSSTNPEAEAYHDAIVEHQGFERLHNIRALRPGDILAVKYTDHHVSSNGVEDTGHVMLVSETPHRNENKKPLIQGTQQYTVTVIDSSASGHGPTDTRARAKGSFTGGIGRGVFRLYANESGRIIGYAWSTGSKSQFYSAPERDLVAGRLTKTAPVPGVENTRLGGVPPGVLRTRY